MELRNQVPEQCDARNLRINCEKPISGLNAVFSWSSKHHYSSTTVVLVSARFRLIPCASTNRAVDHGQCYPSSAQVVSDFTSGFIQTDRTGDYSNVTFKLLHNEPQNCKPASMVGLSSGVRRSDDSQDAC
jgi:hypothetical protein